MADDIDVRIEEQVTEVVIADSVAVDKGLRWRGAWDAVTTYGIDDAVQYAGSAYIALSTNLNSAPPNANWSLLVAKGEAGADFVTPEEHGAVGDGTTDDSTAINAAIAAAYAAGKGVLLGVKTYFCASPITLNVPIIFRGRERQNGSVLKFRNGINGLRVTAGGSRAVVSDLRIIPSSSVGAWSAAAACVAGSTVLRPVSGYAGYVYECTTSGTTGGSEPSWPTTAGATVTSGTAVFTCRHIALLEVLANGCSFTRVTVSTAGGDCLTLDSTLGDNCNLNAFYDCKFDSALGYNVVTLGNDSNVNYFAHCSIEAGGLGGVRDFASLGCIWEAPHFDANNGWAFDMYDPVLTLGSAADIKGAYLENGQLARIAANGMWFGGVNAHNVDTTHGGILDCAESGRNTMLLSQSFGGVDYSRRLMRANSTILEEFGISSDGGRLTQQTYGEVNGASQPGWWGWRYNGSITPFALSTNLAAEGGGKIWMPNGFLAGGTDYNVAIAWGDNAPASGAHKKGEVVYARAGHDGVIGWVCTAAGTPGTWQTLYRAGAARVVRGANLTLTPNDTGKAHTNGSASGTIVFTLPTGAELDTANLPNFFVGKFRVTVAQLLRVQAQGSDVIRYAGQATAAGGYLECGDVDAVLDVEYAGSGVFLVTALMREWSIGP